MELNRTGSIWGRINRNNINNNWGIIESFLKQYDGTRLYEVSYNLYDSRNLGKGSISRTTGAINDDHFSHVLIYVKPNTQYTTTPSGLGAWYDADGEYIDGIDSSSTENRNVVSPSGAYMARITVGAVQIDEFMMYEGWDVKPYKPYGVIPSPLITDPELLEAIEDAKEYFIDFDTRRANQGSDFPLKSVQLRDTPPGEISEHVKNTVLDAKVFGGKVDMYYRFTFIGNGITSNGAVRYGITVEELRIRDGWRERFVFVYNDDITPENQQNANVQKGSDGIDTIIVDNGEIAISITIDREVLGDSNFLNINSSSPTAVIDPMLYFP